MRKLAVPIVVLATILAGCGGKHAPYRTLPRPPLPAGVSAPSCGPGDNHSMGQCLPKSSGSVSPKTLKIPNGITCIDLSNNDPVKGVGAWHIIRARGVRCAVFKVNESTGFVDRQAALMASAAKAAGVLVGGYDFQHVCGPSPASEAHVFSSYLRADGLLGSNTVDPAADVEFRSGSCNARAWEQAWRIEVQKEIGRSPQTYTGAWFWNPTFGAFNPGGYKWVSGYNVSWPFMPAGWHLDQWQWTDAGFNGVTHADMSVFLDGEGSFRALTNQGNPVVYPVCFHKRENPATCAPAKKQVVSYQRAVNSSLAAYTVRHCSVFAQRASYFNGQIKAHPRSSRAASWRRASVASQKVYNRRACGVFQGRVNYYSSRIRQVEAAN